MATKERRAYDGQTARRSARELTHIFADWLRLPPLGDGSDAVDAIASVLPSSVEEVRALSEVAARHSVPLVPFGARTGLESGPTEGEHPRTL